MASTFGPELTSDSAFDVLSPWDKELVYRLKQSYPSDVLSDIFSEAPARHNSLTSHSTHSSGPRSAKSSLSSTGWHRVTSQRSSVSTFGTTVSTSSMALCSPPSESIFCFEAVAEEAERPRTAVDVQRASQAYLNGIADLGRMSESSDRSSIVLKQEAHLESRIIYVCTSCGDAFEELTAWKTHEKSVHELQWSCPHPTCDDVFNRADKFENHHEETHGCNNCSHADEAVRSLPPKRAWGCGFDLCYGSFDNWDQRCAHVAAHYEGFAEQRGSQGRYPHWRYTNMIRNLLRQDAIKDGFRQYMIRRHGESMVSWPKLRWRPNDSGELKRRLEYCDLRQDVEEIVQLAYRLGHPANSETKNRPRRKTDSTGGEKPTHKRIPPSLSLFPPCEPNLGNGSQGVPEELPPNPVVRPLESRPRIPHSSAATGSPLHGYAVSLSSSTHDLIQSTSRSSLRNHVQSHTDPVSTVPKLGCDRNVVSTCASENIGIRPGSMHSLSNSIFAAPDLVHPFNAGLPTETYVVHRPTSPLPLPSPTLSQFPIPPKTPKELLRKAKSMVRR